ncbi:hypothetical protein [Serratia marcescens]|uniref:hypothetical protein n=1 Tax=Serratia marcescens TaxID=615 RepID=UPI003A83E8F2
MFVATSPYAAGETYYGNQAANRLATAVTDHDIIQAARRALERIFITGQPYISKALLTRRISPMGSP